MGRAGITRSTCQSTSRAWPRGEARWQQSGLESVDIDPAAYLVGEILPVGFQQPQPFTLGETAPDAVWLPRHQCVGGAFGPDRATTADRFGGQLTAGAGGTSFAIGVEELSAVPPATILASPLYRISA